jgi:hypothetical protein
MKSCNSLRRVTPHPLDCAKIREIIVADDDNESNEADPVSARLDRVLRPDKLRDGTVGDRVVEL